ncbi:unnamed protein product [Mucor hiemalis]
MGPEKNNSEGKKSNAGRKSGTMNKPGARKPGPKPKHLRNQQSIKGFYSPMVNNNGESSSTPSGHANVTADAEPAVEGDNRRTVSGEEPSLYNPDSEISHLEVSEVSEVSEVAEEEVTNETVICTTACTTQGSELGSVIEVMSDQEDDVRLRICVNVNNTERQC